MQGLGVLEGPSWPPRDPEAAIGAARCFLQLIQALRSARHPQHRPWSSHDLPWQGRPGAGNTGLPHLSLSQLRKPRRAGWGTQTIGPEP